MTLLKEHLLRALAHGFLVGCALFASSAMAQRGISQTSSGNDPTLEIAVNRLVGCDIGNTNARINGNTSGGAADACSRVSQFGETLAQVQAIAASYNAANPSSPYALQLVNTAADRLSQGSTISSGGLFGIVAGGGLLGNGGLGNGHLEMQFNRGAVGSFVMAFSGTYNDGIPGNAADQWSAYYLFDDVEIRPFGFDNLGTGLMNYRLFDYRFQFVPSTGLFQRFRDYTSSLVVNQVSIYQLDRETRPGTVPEPGTWALVLAALTGAAVMRRRRRFALGA
jgi:hypothetical protein